MYGPSPRAWGSGPPRPHPRRHRRSIPTCVGLGATPSAHRVAAAVHPHVRGARDVQGILTGSADGPSPRAWGSAGPRGPRPRHVRSIPTCVGLGAAPSAHRVAAALHPHVREARDVQGILTGSADGPSPRAWGSAGPRGPRPRHVRSIPTCVGLGPLPRGRRHHCAVHPHVRGARSPPATWCSGRCGPSPRAWGSGILTGDSRTRHRSIPTCVGLGLPDLRKLSPLPICNQNYRSDTRTCNNTVTPCGCPYGHGYSPTLIPAYAQHWLAALTTNQPRTQSDVRNTVTRYSSTIIHPD